MCMLNFAVQACISSTNTRLTLVDLLATANAYSMTTVCRSQLLPVHGHTSCAMRKDVPILRCHCKWCVAHKLHCLDILLATPEGKAIEDESSSYSVSELRRAGLAATANQAWCSTLSR